MRSRAGIVATKNEQVAVAMVLANGGGEDGG